MKWNPLFVMPLLAPLLWAGEKWLDSRDAEPEPKPAEIFGSRAIGTPVSAGTSRTPCACRRRDTGDSGSTADWSNYSAGVRWHTSLAEALKIAWEEGKLVFYYHVVGDLDKEGC